MIQLKHFELERIAGEIEALASEAFQIQTNFPLSVSLGETAKSVEATYAALNTICREELPELFSGSAKLLRAISAAFRSADEQAAEMIEQ